MRKDLFNWLSLNVDKNLELLLLTHDNMGLCNIDVMMLIASAIFFPQEI